MENYVLHKLGDAHEYFKWSDSFDRILAKEKCLMIKGQASDNGKFRVLLVYPNLQMVNLLPSNIALLSACLKRAGVDVRLFDTTLYKTEDKSIDDVRVDYLQVRKFNLAEKGVQYKSEDVVSDFCKAVSEYAPHLIGVSVTDDTFPLAVRMMSALPKEERHVVVGGVHATFSADKVLAYDWVDSACIGEGEEALVELCQALRAGEDVRNIRNLWVKADGEVVRNPMRPPVDIDNLPEEDFSIFEGQRFFRPMQGKVYRMIPFNMDRGCPFDCAFCAAPLYRQAYRGCGMGSYFRAKSLRRVKEELLAQVSRYRADYIYFNSETFFARSDSDLEDFADFYAKEIGLPFWCQTRIETIKSNRIQLLERMGCDRISVGIEHGNEEFRRKVLRKHFTNQQVLEAFDILGKGRIPVTVNNMIGFPDETRELAMDTVRLNRQIRADSINAFFFVPYSGTPLRQYAIEKGYMVEETASDGLMRNSVLRMPQFSQAHIKGMLRVFPLYIKMPEEFFSRIREAEELSPKGDEVFAELRELFWKIR